MTEKWEIGNIDNSPMGSTTPAAGAFTTLKASTDPTDEHGVGDRAFNDARYALESNNLSDLDSAATAFGNIKQDATDAATGVVELATDAETVTGTATDKVTTPANITAKMAAPGAIGGTTPAAGAFTTLTASTDPTDEHGVGDRGYNDLRYANIDHDANHITGGSDEIDGDKLDIDMTPTNYSPDTSPGEVDNADNLSAHLKGIDNALGGYYGLTWNESTDAYARTGSLLGIATGASPGNAFLPIQAAMKRCVISDAGVVQYYLDASDSTKKADGSAATLDGTDGQVMVEIPKFYVRYSYSTNVHTWDISFSPLAGFVAHPAFYKDGAWVDYRYFGAYEGSMYDDSGSAMVGDADIETDMYASGDKLCSVSGEYPKTNETRAEFRAMASERGAGWRNQDYFLTTAVQLLYLVEYADFDSQDMIGNGRTMFSNGAWEAANQGNGKYIGQCGYSNSDGNASNATDRASAFDIAAIDTSQADYKDYMTYRGIENFFGNVWTWVDGINVGMAGAHDGGNDEAALTDSGESWPTDSLVGATIANTTDGSSGTITANTGTTVTATLSGGTDNNWDTGDAYTIDNIPWTCNNENNYADDTYANYDRMVDINGDPVTLHNANGYPATVEQVQAGFLAASVGASDSTKLCDYYYQSTGWRVVNFGGGANNSLGNGAFYVNANNTSSNDNVTIGGQLYLWKINPLGPGTLPLGKTQSKARFWCW